MLLLTRVRGPRYAEQTDATADAELRRWRRHKTPAAERRGDDSSADGQIAIKIRGHLPLKITHATPAARVCAGP